MRNHRHIVLLLIGVMFSTGLFAQTRTIKFTGRDCTDQYHIPLSRVEVFNLDQLWQEVLYYPDTILVLGTTGVDVVDKPSGLQLRQNVPNPFDGATHFSLSLSEDCDVWMEILDMDGKVVVKELFAALETGTHLFRATLESPQTYLLSASVTNDRISIKMINKGHGGSNDISHVGMVDPNGNWTLFLKNDCANGAYPFSLGDEMRYVGYADIDGMERTSDPVIVQLQNNTTVHLKFDVTLPAVFTQSISNVTQTTATCGGSVSDNGGAAVTARGVCWSTSQNPTVNDSHTTDGAGEGSFGSSITGLVAGNTYYVRAYATNAVGTAYGAQTSFTTISTVPTVSTTSISNITANSATCHSNVTDDGGTAVTARGVCWSTLQNPTISNSHTNNGSGSGNFHSDLTDLSANTTYYVRAYATNSVGTAYGNQVSFVTTSAGGTDGQPCPNAATVTDYDGNVYNTVKIGNQCWTKENIRTTHYSDGTSISLGSGSSETVAYRYYPNNNSSNVYTYGYLYNWKAMMHNSTSSSTNPSGVQGICPTGWHVPSNAEWIQLTDYVGSQSQYVCESSNLKIGKSLSSSTGWSASSNTCSVGYLPNLNNATGFSAMPAGSGGGTSGFGQSAYLWSATDGTSSGHSFGYNIHYSFAFMDRGNYGKGCFFSVRCVKD